MARAACGMDRPAYRGDTGRAMSQENVEVVRGIYEGWARGERADALDAVGLRE
jgi:hypothetical protein